MYGNVMEIMFTCAMYAALIPLGISLITHVKGLLLSVLGLFIEYWFMKYNLLRNSTVEYK